MQCAEASQSSLDHPFAQLPRLAEISPLCNEAIPSDDECFALWNKYGMLENVRRHSAEVAAIATEIAERAYSAGYKIDTAAVRASALLHDIAKTWCLRNGGGHALMGSSWIAQETGNFKISQGVALHVHWPWELAQDEEILSLPILVIYADKRVKHDRPVSLQERFDDLIIRYGKTQSAREGIANSLSQAREIERLLSKLLLWNLHEYTFTDRRLVQ